MTALLDGTVVFPDQFVASFGKDAALGCFTAPEAVTFSRRDKVLLQTPRGLEIGEILGPANLRQSRLLGAQVRGEIVRALTPVDEPVVSKMKSLAHDVLAAAEAARCESETGLSLIDAEVFFDLRNALLHILHPNPDGLAAFVDAVTARTGLIVRLANLALPAEPEQHGCGEPNCGGGEGGCSSGGCSTGGCATGCGTPSSAVPDLRPYFAHLREKMEAGRVPLV